MYVSTYSKRGMGDAASTAIGGGISAGVGLATNAAALWMNSINLSHQADTATTQIVNGLEPLLNQNKNAYLAGPGTCADQAAALAAFDGAWLWLTSPKACGNGAYGSAGNRCVSDRGPGGKFPWFSWYRDPIANDPRAAGCAAELAANNPDAALESAVANLANLTGGSYQQTAPGQFSGSSSNSSGSTVPFATDSAAAVSNALSSIPTWVWLAGAGLAVFVALK